MEKNLSNDLTKNFPGIPNGKFSGSIISLTHCLHFMLEKRIVQVSVQKVDTIFKFSFPFCNYMTVSMTTLVDLSLAHSTK